MTEIRPCEQRTIKRIKINNTSYVEIAYNYFPIHFIVGKKLHKCTFIKHLNHISLPYFDGINNFYKMYCTI